MDIRNHRKKVDIAGYHILETVPIAAWATRQVFGKSIYARGFRDNFEAQFPNPDILIPGR